jgi:ABC-type arginine transport system ATPase subunit
MLHLLALKYDINRVAVKKPNLMLFDEPDKSWDPNFIQIFLDIIIEFHLKNNIQIILTK